MNLLFTCAGRRTYLLKYFKENLSEGDKVIATDMQSSAPAFSMADIIEQVPNVYTKDYVDKILLICRKYNVTAIISLNDLELPILSDNRERFDCIGVKLIISSPEVVDCCFDKYKTANYLLSLGLKTPETFIDFNEAVEAIENGKIVYPLVLKPRWGSGSIGIEIVNDKEEMKLVYEFLCRKIRRTILSRVSKSENYILIQEMISGLEYGMDIMNDLRGNNITVAVKRKLSMRAGETDKAVIVDNNIIRNIGKVIGENLKHIGNLDCDLLERNGEYYVLELNPRFGGGFPFSYEAGVNLPKAIIEWLKGNEIDVSILQPVYGKLFAKCDYLVELK